MALHSSRQGRRIYCDSVGPASVAVNMISGERLPIFLTGRADELPPLLDQSDYDIPKRLRWRI
jgi:hypothetical protein